ncbi:Lamina-associated polypeptide 2, isoforms alpha/zeta [Myotis davidii]|uniref:Lamina-associated polypeptide 2, isoforms alpha/zeta n=1 Tax=Myotis davidii TaxID=225400 RepID=L5M985_MYODS|nr:Lamina-associated polypeptide 2, isoforms alpha/zeta [Myotis davidii]
MKPQDGEDLSLWDGRTETQAREMRGLSRIHKGTCDLSPGSSVDASTLQVLVPWSAVTSGETLVSNCPSQLRVSSVGFELFVQGQVLSSLRKSGPESKGLCTRCGPKARSGVALFSSHGKATKKTDKPRLEDKDDLDVTELTNEALLDQLVKYGVGSDGVDFTPSQALPHVDPVGHVESWLPLLGLHIELHAVHGLVKLAVQERGSPPTVQNKGSSMRSSVSDFK